MERRLIKCYSGLGGYGVNGLNVNVHIFVYCVFIAITAGLNYSTNRRNTPGMFHMKHSGGIVYSGLLATINALGKPAFLITER